MVTIKAQTRQGEEKTFSAEVGANLMETLRDSDLVEGTCGGAASCGTCHIYVAADWIEKLGSRTEDEGYMLEALEEVVEVKPTSRLACQITLAETHDGLSLEVAPEE